MEGKKKLKVLFICMDNSVRSPIAAEFLNTYFGDRYEAYSVGIEPCEINPHTVEVMKEIGIDISKHRAKNIEEFRSERFDCIINLCEYCAAFLPRLPEHKKYLKKNLKNYCIPICCDIAKKFEICFPEYMKRRPAKEEILTTFRCLREAIFEWVEKEAVF